MEPTLLESIFGSRRQELRHQEKENAYALLFAHHKVLLVLHRKGFNQGLWDLPGGEIEKGETPREAMLREVSEETGLHLETVPIQPFTVLTQHLGPDSYDRTLSINGTVFKGELPELLPVSPDPSDEGTESAGWYAQFDLPATSLTSLARQALALAHFNPGAVDVL